VLHGQVLEVLLDGGHGDDARLQLTGLHALAELAAGVLSQQDLGGARHQFAPGKCSFAISSVRFVLAPAVPLLESDYHLAEIEVLQQ
jgi:hypothetical protein